MPIATHPTRRPPDDAPEQQQSDEAKIETGHTEASFGFPFFLPHTTASVTAHRASDVSSKQANVNPRIARNGRDRKRSTGRSR
jgi:hypothetical protein